MTKIKNEKRSTFFIHYSCESFENLDGYTPRIASISLMNFESLQIISFSIHLEAQIQGFNFKELNNKQLDLCEKGMLKNYFNFLKKNNSSNFVHWLMNTPTYGFEAIKNRYKILKGNPVDLNDNIKINLSEILCLIYGYNYEVDKPDGRLIHLCERNNISPLGLLKGREEAELFKQRDWLKLSNSTNAKVKSLLYIVRKHYKKELKTNSNIVEKYGLTMRGLEELKDNSYILKTIWWLIILFIGFYLRDLYNAVKSIG
ncbi:hypothetical protein [Nonlabens sp. Asnod2-A12]|uniref:hypothetical protein n=1 Tax=Nonlabens sp. Asnod2-A12 TaxID=3160578 RepID=UPI003869458C